MATRNVWSKWNSNSSTSYVGNEVSASWSQTWTGGFSGFASSYSVNPTTGEVTLQVTDDLSRTGWDSTYHRHSTYKYMYVSSQTGSENGLYTTLKYTKALVVSLKTTYSKGTISYGNISSVSANAYPADNYSDGYWYTKLGTDIIDPASVSYDTPHGGELLDIVVTPSAFIQYGGTISYKYEISTDGGSTWSEANAGTTATTISVLIPEGVETFQARVTASDDMGFTSTDAVMGESMSVINNAAPVITCMMLDLGKLAAAFSVDYSVSDEDGDEMTIIEAVDGVKNRDFVIPTGGGTR